jgi:hypothetical protein
MFTQQLLNCTTDMRYVITGPSSDMLVQYLTSTSCAKGKRIIELGTGCGYVGLAAAVLEAQSVTMTDMMVTQSRMEYDAEGILVAGELDNASRVLLNNCDYNISLNEALIQNCRVDTQPLHWGKDYQYEIDKIVDRMESCDLVLGSDLTYCANVSHHLFWTISYILRQQEQKQNGAQKSSSDTNNNKPRCRCLLAHEQRLNESTGIVLAAAKEMGLRHVELIMASGNTYKKEQATTSGEGDKKFVLWEMFLDTDDYSSPLITSTDNSFSF